MSNRLSPLLLLLSVLGAQAQQLSDFPKCTQICQLELQDNIVNPTDLTLLCGADFRASTSVCQAATCTDAERQLTDALSQKVCGPLYSSNATLASAVSSAIASATPLAIQATAGKDETNVNNYPPCAQSCQRQYNFGICPGGLTNRTCICLPNPAILPIGYCELANCSTDDLTRTQALAEKLCAPVGGIQSNGTTGSDATNTTTKISPSPSPFLGAAVHGVEAGFLGSLMGLATVVSALMML